MPPKNSRSTSACSIVCDQLVRRHRLALDAEAGADLGRQLDRLRLALEDARRRARAASRRTRSQEPRARSNRRLRSAKLAAGSGSGSTKMCRWLKAPTRRVCSRQQHAVAEHVARHVADADAGEVLGLDVGAELAEMALHRFPGAAGGDAHLLVVVAGRAAGGEGVVQPEAVIRRHAVGDVGEGGGALVGRDHEIGIVLVMADHVAPDGMTSPPTMVVGDVEQAAHQGLVAFDAFGLDRLAAGRAGRRALQHEAALRADRHDDGVLHHLRLHQARGSRCGNPRAGRTSGCRRARPCRRADARPRCAGCRRRSRASGRGSGSSSTDRLSSFSER